MKRRPAKQAAEDTFETVRTVGLALPGVEASTKYDGSPVLEPTWGEAELLMNLASANLNRTTPDLVAAERYAQSALALVPYWHYVRDILLPQIRKGKDQGH